MQSDRAAEHLQVIRTLMERAALYRRALAPVMILTGGLGTAAAVAGLGLPVGSVRAFVLFWLGVAVLAMAGAFLLARRQALKDAEPFWSPPTRRVAQALAPPLTLGLALGLVFVLFDEDEEAVLALVLFWIAFYGCALHAAGFFMPRGMRLFGWLFVVGAMLALFLLSVVEPEAGLREAHGLMGVFFGLLQLAYGAYLYFTERRKPAA